MTIRETSLTIETQTGSTHLFALSEASEMSGMHPEMIDEFLRAHLLRAVAYEKDVPLFDVSCIYRMRQIENLRIQQHANLRTIRLIVELMDRLETAEDELRRLRNRII